MTGSKRRNRGESDIKETIISFLGGRLDWRGGRTNLSAKERPGSTACIGWPRSPSRRIPGETNEHAKASG